MQNVISPILKQKKLGSDLFGVLCQISALCYITTIIQFLNAEKAGKWKLEKHITGTQIEHRKSFDLNMHTYDWYQLSLRM